MPDQPSSGPHRRAPGFPEFVRPLSAHAPRPFVRPPQLPRSWLRFQRRVRRFARGLSGSQILFIKSDPLCNQITVGISPSLSLHTQPSHNVSYRIFLLAPESSAMGGHVCVAHQEHGCFGPTRVAYSERISASDTDHALKFYLLTLWYPYGSHIGGVLRCGRASSCQTYYNVQPSSGY